MNNSAIKYGWLRSTIYIIALLIIIAGFGIPAVLIVTKISGQPFTEISLFDKKNIHLLLLYQAILLSGVTALTFLFRKYIDRMNIVSLGFYKFHMRNDLWLGLVLGLALIGSGFAILNLSGNIQVKNITFDYNYLAGSIILFLFISWIEEIAFRAYILNNFMDSFHPYLALLLSSVLFALFHGFNPGMSIVGFINLTLAGILLGIVFLYTKTIWFALSLHFSWNFFQGPVFGFPVSGMEMNGFLNQERKGNELLTGGDFGLEGSILCSLLIILCIFALHRYYNKPANESLNRSQ